MKKNYIFACVLAACSVGASAQITQVTDINAKGGAGIASPTLYNGEIYFEADAGDDAADELYKYSPATGETVLVKDINQDPGGSSPAGDPSGFIEFDGKLYFKANAGKGTSTAPLPYKELHVTDGTTNGTSLYFDGNPAYGKSGNPQQSFVFDGKLYTQLNDGTTTQLWATDGESDPIKVEYTGNTGYFTPSKAIVDTDKVWLKGTGASGKAQLITFNGTTYTEMTTTTSQHAYGGLGIVFGDKFIFTGKDDLKNSELWISDATQAGTVLLKDIWTGVDADSVENSSTPGDYIAYQSEVYFTATVDDKTQLWKTDGTEAGTVLAYAPDDSINTGISNLIEFASTLFFTITTESGSEELWAFDGTSATKYASFLSAPSGFIVAGDILFFIVDSELWCTTGVVEETRMVYTLFTDGVHPTSVDDEYVVDGTVLYFTGDDQYGDEMFAIDATTITDFTTSYTFNLIDNIHSYNGEIYFEGDANNGLEDELYKQTAYGEYVLVADINQDTADLSPDGNPKNFIEFDGNLYMNANGGDNLGSDQELYVTNGVYTSLVFDFNTAPTKGGNPQQMFVANDKLWMQVNDGSSTQFWAYDGDTTIKMTNINNGGYASTMNAKVDEANEITYFQANDSRAKLFVIDSNDSIYSLTISGEATNTDCSLTTAILFDNGLIFEGDDAVNGDELWYSNGTEEGTYLIKNINEGDANSDPSDFVMNDSIVYFIASADSVNGIWYTDGTENGTQQAYLGSADVEELFVIGETVIFYQDTTLMKLNGTSAEILAEFDVQLSNFTYHGDLLFFEEDGQLWYTDGNKVNTKAIEGIDNVSGTALLSSDLLYYVAENTGEFTIESFDASTIELNPVTSLPRNDVETVAVTLYPMPSNGVINIASAEQFTSYAVYDISMKAIASSVLENDQINLNLPVGVYILQLQNESNTVTKTIMIK